MSYRVLARAYRSRTFDEVLGQDVIAATLANAIRSGRIHHGYLFTGTRGVGKTSMARILAKALNCLRSNEPTVTPCGECDSCRAIAAGEDIDVLEIDAASHTGVDNIRDLRANAGFRPARSRFRVYIVDEVHMLSAGAFNALLKTLEEPPDHVKFILATTETHKVPATIQSRCQRFDFKALDLATIAAHLGKLCAAESVTIDEPVLRRVARLANGSMRDALSLLDKLLSFGGSHLTMAEVDELLPPSHDELAAAVIARVAEHDPAGALSALDAALQSGRTVDRFCDHLIDHVRTLMLLNVCGAETDLVDVPSSLRAALFERSKAFDPPTYVFMIALLEELRRNVKFSGAARALADAAMVRLALANQFSDIKRIIERLDGLGGEAGRPSPSAASPSPRAPATPYPPRASSAQAPSPAQAPRAASPGQASRTAPAAEPSTRQPAPAKPAGRDAGQVPPEGTVALGDAGTPQGQVDAATRERVLRDPYVQKVREMVDGTIIGIFPAPKKTEVAEGGSDESGVPPTAQGDGEMALFG